MESTNIDDVLTEAAKTNTREGNDTLFAKLQGREIFFGVKLEKKIDPRDGQEREVAVSSPLLRLSSGQNAFMVYTSKEDARLPRPFGGATWERALRLLLEMADADGLILSTPSKNSIAVDKQSARRVLSLFSENEAPPRARR